MKKSLDEYLESKNIKLLKKQYSFVKFLVDCIDDSTEAQLFLQGPIATGKTFALQIIEDYYRIR